jgi:hypothetical protein
MSSFIRNRRWKHTNGCDCDVIIKCDKCGRTEIAAEGQTDRLLVNSYVHANNWKTIKKNDKWINLCPDCKRANSIGENIKDKRLEEALVQFANHLKEILQDDKPKGISGEYAEYLKSAEWQAKRNERLRVDNYTCQRCGGKRNLQVHHLTYANIGHEDVHNDLITMCKDCHEDIEKEKRKSARPQDFVLGEVKRLEDIERVEKETLEKKKQEEEQARERYVERKRTQLVNTYRVLALIKGRDIGEGGKDNLCNNDKFIEVLAEYGYKIDDVDRWFIHWEVVYNRWCLVRKLSQAGLSVSEITKQMRWTYEKVKKATDERSERKFKDMLISHKNREDILSRAITGDTIFYNE